MEHIKIHEQVRLVDGYLRSVAYDLPRVEFFFLPKSLSVFLKKNDKKRSAIFKANDEFNEYLKFLLDKEIIFYEDGALMDNFAPLDLEWDSPFPVTNIIIDTDLTDKELLSAEVEIIDKLNIQHLHFNLLRVPKKADIIKLLKSFDTSTVQSINVLFPALKEIELVEFLKICSQYLRVQNLFVPKSVEKVNYPKTERLSVIYYDFSNIPEKTIYNFITNITLFTEAQKHNVYYNRKMYIDKAGVVKNAPECKEDFGNVFTHINKAMSLVGSPEFKKYSLVSKDKCDVCRDCEFRYMCNDNRLPIQRNKSEWYFESECPYNPYIAKWNNEEGYKNLSDCGITSNKNEFTINRKKLNSVISYLWD